MNDTTQIKEEDDWGTYKPRGSMAAAMDPLSPFAEQVAPAVQTPSRNSNPVAPAREGGGESSGAGGRSRTPHRGKPNHFPAFISRSAMFRVSSSGDSFNQATEVKAQGCALWLKGPKLGMRDKLVWEIAIQVAKERAEDLGQPFNIELRDFAKRMKSNEGGRALASIRESLNRLASCRVEFEIGESCKGIGCLIATVAEDQGGLFVRLNPDFALPALLCEKQFLFDQARRSKLKSALAQWLHDFYSTHSVTRDLDLQYLRELCGFDGDPKQFPKRLRDAMADLVANARGVVSASTIQVVGRRSDSWKLIVTKGVEKPSFLPAQKAPAPKSAAKRGGVAL